MSILKKASGVLVSLLCRWECDYHMKCFYFLFCLHLPGGMASNICAWHLYRHPAYWTSKNLASSHFLADICNGKEFEVIDLFNVSSLLWNELNKMPGEYVLPLVRSFYEVFLESGLTRFVSYLTYVQSEKIMYCTLISKSDTTLRLILSTITMVFLNFSLNWSLQS